MLFLCILSILFRSIGKRYVTPKGASVYSICSVVFRQFNVCSYKVCWFKVYFVGLSLLQAREELVAAQAEARSAGDAAAAAMEKTLAELREDLEAANNSLDNANNASEQWRRR